MNKGHNNRYNSNKFLTARQKQLIIRKFTKRVITSTLIILLTLILSGVFNKAQAHDNMHKYYTSIEIESGDTLYGLSNTYGSNFKSKNVFIKEVCMINKIEKDDIKAGMLLVVPYYSEELK